MSLFKRLLLILTMLLVSSSLSLAYNYNPHTDKAVEIADNLIAWQTNSGGWNKNVDYSVVMWEPGMARGTTNSQGQELGTFDNDASIDEMRFLAWMYNARGYERYRESFMKGFEWMLAAQYPSGGWPQYYPLRGGYSNHVTFNDHAMQRVLTFIQEIMRNSDDYRFIGDENFARLEAAFEKGIDYILKAQNEVNGHLTVWCQQHDPVTYEPQMGRPYEHIANVSSESVRVVEFLMSLEDPTPEVRRAILSALEWYEIARLPDGNWARFYDIESNVPIFSGRDSIIRYQMTDIELERQQGYSWYTFGPQNLLANAKASGYLDQLRASLPDHQSITLDVFADPAIPLLKNPTIWPTTIANSNLPVHVEIMIRDPQNLKEVIIKLRDEEVYRGTDLNIMFNLDISEMWNGRAVMRVETMTETGIASVQESIFMIYNR